MKLGDIVAYRACYRADGKVGGWQWRTLHGRVLKVNRKTAQILRLSEHGEPWGRSDMVALDRIVAKQEASDGA